MEFDKKTVLKAAQHMIDRYGDSALAEVDQRIEELESRDQMDALELWRAVRKAIEFRQRTSPDETTH